MSKGNGLAPLITNQRGKREWEWVVRQVGEERALAAIAALGGRRPYPLNVARVLGLEIPQAVTEGGRQAPGEGVFSTLRRALAGGKDGG